MAWFVQEVTNQLSTEAALDVTTKSDLIDQVTDE